MIENIKEIYDTLSSNSIATAVILTPLITGASYFILKTIPGTVLSYIKGLVTTNITIYQATDQMSFELGEYMLFKYKFYAPFKSFMLRALPFTNVQKLILGNYSTAYSIIEGIPVIVRRYSDRSEKMNHAFVLSFSFLTRNRKKINDLFDKMREEMNTSLYTDEILIDIPGVWAYDKNLTRIKKKDNTKPVTNDQKKLLERVIKCVNSGKYNNLGIMIHGKPGTGKSNIALQIACATGYRICYLDSFHLSDSNLAMVIAHVVQPSIILIEDIDCCRLVKERTAESNDYYKVDTSKLSTLLNILDGVLGLDKQIVIATTNHYDTLDSALKRKGRFDITCELKYMEREEIISYIADTFEMQDTKHLIAQEIFTWETKRKMGDLSLPIASVSAACREADDYKNAIRIMFEDME